MALFIALAVVGDIVMMWILCGVTQDVLRSRTHHVRLKKVGYSPAAPPTAIDEFRDRSPRFRKERLG